MSFVAHNPVLRLRLRMALVMVVPVAIVALVLFKVYDLQNVQGAELKRRYDAQHQDRFEFKSRRGMMRDRKGRVLAGTVEVDSVSLRPEKILPPDRPAAADKLAAALGSSREWVQAKLDSKRPFEWLQRQADPAVAARVKTLALPGVALEHEFKRSWPQGPLAGQLLGFTDIDGRGRAGLEGSHEALLAGRSSYVDGLRDGMRQAIFDSGLVDGDALEGKSLTLTIDSVIQSIAEEELGQAVKDRGARRGVAVVIDPHTGDLLAMALAPAFDPNSRKKTPVEFNNWAVTEVFEPGSVMKVFTLATALDLGEVDLTTPINCELGHYRIGRHTIHDHSPAGTLSAKEVLTISSNIGISKIAEKVNKERLYASLVRMGLHGPTGSDAFFPKETNGLLNAPDRWPAIQLANVAFGQGIAVTPLQLASALSGIANGGELMRPRVVTRIEQRTRTGRQVQELPPVSRGRVISRTAARDVTEAMVSVVNDPRGTGSRGKVPGFTVAGKTGTAQKVDPATGLYADRWVGTFVGFLPAEDPQLVVLVTLDEPEPVHYGGIVAAPVFARIAARTLTYLGIYGKPDAAAQAKSAALAAAAPAAAAAPPAAAAPSGEEAADGPLVDVDGGAGAPGDGLPRPVTVPSFGGLSIRAALALAEKSGLTLTVEGSGKAAEQEPLPGDVVSPGSACRVRFVHPGGGTL